MPFTLPSNYDPNSVTLLCKIMGRYGSDKGHENNNNWHNYTTYYNKLFENSQNDSLDIFELGLGTNNINIPSNMGKNGIPGASLRGWREYFPNSQIYGADIDKDILFQDERIKTYWCDQLSPEAIKNLWSNETLPKFFDIIIEDGLHTFDANKIFFENSIHKLKSGGVYIIEDIGLNKLKTYKKQISIWETLYPELIFSIVNIPHNNNTFDNCLIVALKK
jgi:hypothetical protein